MFLRWTAALLFLSACGRDPECHGHYAVSSEFSETNKANVRRSAERWNAFAYVQITLEYADRDTCSIKPTITGSEIYREIEATDGPWAGAFHSDSGNLYLVTDFSQNDAVIQSILLHEIGHGFGLDHIAEPGIMWTEQYELNFTKADLRECRRVHACH